MDRKRLKSISCLPENNSHLDEMLLYFNQYGFNFIKDPVLQSTIKDETTKYVIEYIAFNRNLEQKYCYRQRRHYAAHDYNYVAIFEDEWHHRKEQVREFILTKLGHCSRRVFARKCDIREVDKQVSIQFICENHIQPVNNGGVVNLGLYYENELLGLCQLRKHHRTNVDITISRICFLKNVKVVGGFSRLVKNAVGWSFNNGYDQVITWSDNRLTTGESYEKSGFVRERVYNQDYSYIHPDKPYRRINKQLMQKKKLKVPDGYTEKEWTEKLGYQRLWDCGKTKFVYYKANNE
jgi:hypothetical protein